MPLPAKPRFGHSSTQHRNVGLFMTTINLNDFYYWYTQDQFIEVSDELRKIAEYIEINTTEDTAVAG